MKISPGVLSFVLLPQAVAFSMAPAFGRRISIPYSALFQLPENYERAVDCAEDYGECEVEELVDLVNGEKFAALNIVLKFYHSYAPESFSSIFFHSRNK